MKFLSSHSAITSTSVNALRKTELNFWTRFNDLLTNDGESFERVETDEWTQKRLSWVSCCRLSSLALTYCTVYRLSPLSVSQFVKIKFHPPPLSWPPLLSLDMDFGMLLLDSLVDWQFQTWIKLEKNEFKYSTLSHYAYMFVPINLIVIKSESTNMNYPYRKWSWKRLQLHRMLAVCVVWSHFQFSINENCKRCCFFSSSGYGETTRIQKIDLSVRNEIY